MSRILASIFLVLIYTTGFSQPGETDPTFNPGDTGFGNGDGAIYTGYIYSTTILPNQKMIVAGNFSAYNTRLINCVAKLNADGSLDTSFHSGFVTPPSGMLGTIYATALQSDGKIILAGSFQEYGGFQRNCIVRIHPSGVIDTLFDIGTGANGKINSVVVQATGKVVIGGEFTSFNGVTQNRIARLNTDGSLDATFNPSGSGFDYYVTSLAIDGNQSIVVGGYFTSFNGGTKNYTARLDGTTGGLDASFNAGTGPNGTVKTVLIQPDGKILIGGGFTAYNGISKNGVLRLNPDGSLDNSFNFSTTVTGNMTIPAMGLQSDGKIICSITGPAGGRWALRLNSNGLEDTSFVSGLDVWFELNCVAIQSDDKIIIGGFNNTVFNVSTFCKNQSGVTRLNPGGSWDVTFNPGTGFNRKVCSTAVQPDGKLLVGGDFTRYNGKMVGYLARLYPDGSLDTTFVQNDLTGNVRAIAIQADGKIIIGGDFRVMYSGIPHRILRLNPDGSRDNSFNVSFQNNSSGSVNTLKIDPTGKILVGGSFGPWSAFRLNPDGSWDNTFSLSTTNFNWFEVSCAEVLSNGNYIVGGYLTPNSGQVQKNLRRLFPSGAFDNTFNLGNGANNYVYTMASQADGKIVIGGAFTTYNGVARNYIARINADGSLDNSFDPGLGTDYWVRTVLIQPNGKIVIGGEFNTYNGIPCKGLVRLNSDGSIDPTFDLGSGMDGKVNALSFLGSDIVAGGDFVSYQGVGRNRIARILTCPPITLTLNSTDVTCNGGSDGAISASLIGGTSPYSYSWSAGATTQTINNLAAGTYQLTITDAEGCIKSQSINIQEPAVIQNSIPVTSCDSFTWSQTNQTYSVSGLYSDTLSSVVNGCDSIITLNLTITHSNTGTDIQTACDSLTWIDGITYYSSTNSPTFVLQNAAGCDSIVTLNLTIIPSLPLIIANSFSMPSDANACVGEVAVTVSGNADFELDFDNGSQVITSSGYSLVTNLCAGIHDLHVTDHCGDTLSTTIVIPVDSNYVFNNPFIDSLAVDSLGVTVTNCDIYYAGIDTAYIDSIWANGNTVNVIWNIVDSNGSNFDTTSYVLNNGNGVYWLQLSVFCPNKSVGQYFAVTEAIYFNNGSVSTAGLADYKQALFEVYPNPTNNQVTINFRGSDAELTVYDLHGKVVLRNSIQNQQTIYLENFERGVYLFDLRNSQGQSVKRVVKQ